MFRHIDYGVKVDFFANGFKGLSAIFACYITKMITNLKLYILLLFSILTVGCSSMGVEPWERNILAEKDMIFHTDVIAVKFEEQFYHSKEGSSGGRGFSGGGCGCN